MTKFIHTLQRIWLEVFHPPTDGRLDYCRCGDSWPCSLRRAWTGQESDD